MRLASEEEGGRGRLVYLPLPAAVRHSLGRYGGYISVGEREKNGGRECFWLFLFTKEQRREREWMGGRASGRMNE